MTDRGQQIERICQSALELGESRRRAFLDEAYAGDEELRREMKSLLQFDSRGGRFIEQSALEVTAKMIAQEKPESLLGQQLGFTRSFLCLARVARVWSTKPRHQAGPSARAQTPPQYVFQQHDTQSRGSSGRSVRRYVKNSVAVLALNRLAPPGPAGAAPKGF
jgi:hypothetical protein